MLATLPHNASHKQLQNFKTQAKPCVARWSDGASTASYVDKDTVLITGCSNSDDSPHIIKDRPERDLGEQAGILSLLTA